VNDETLRICVKLDDFSSRLFHAYQDLALAEVERG